MGCGYESRILRIRIQEFLLYPDPDAGFYSRLKVEKNIQLKKFKIVKSVASMKGVSFKRSLKPSRDQSKSYNFFLFPGAGSGS
jgi:hypothetical protein